jgi:hypothetical protein
VGLEAVCICVYAEGWCIESSGELGHETPSHATSAVCDDSTQAAPAKSGLHIVAHAAAEVCFKHLSHMHCIAEVWRGSWLAPQSGPGAD